jgi:hypothetical protein
MVGFVDLQSAFNTLYHAEEDDLETAPRWTPDSIPLDANPPVQPPLEGYSGPGFIKDGLF